MGIFKKLFGGLKGRPGPPPRNVAELVEPLVAPALHLVRSEQEAESFFGGDPKLKSDVEWPANDSGPLTFLASIDLKSLQEELPIPWLPGSGRLLFFYDVENQPWGFDPRDRSGWEVIHVDPPSGSDGHGNGPSLSRSYLSLRTIDTYPSWERPQVSHLELTDAEAEQLIDLASLPYGDEPVHQIGGFPSPVQGDDMELECQLASNGLYCGDSSEYDKARAAELAEGAGDWRLLLQLDSDDDLGAMWGDGGIIYFWIREEDARAARFDHAWLVLQCY